MIVIAVDDEEGARKLLGKSVTANLPDDDVELFSSPAEALAFSKKNIPDIAFLDVDMPDMNGIELAKRLIKINPSINIIFVTGYSAYATEAFSIHASGYLTKPVTPKDVKKELANLRNVVTDDKNGVFIKTFGNFDVIKDGHHLAFQRGPAKEVLAYLVDRQGASVTRKELAAVLFEDEEYSRSNQSYITQIIKSLQNTLEEAGIADILDFSHNSYAVNVNAFKCDCYEFLAGNKSGDSAFNGEYMSQYSWSEEVIGKFY